MKKRIIYFLVLFFGGTMIASGYYAYFLIDKSTIQTTLSTFQSTTTPIEVSFDRFLFNMPEGEAPYRLTRYEPCENVDENNNCISATPNLCPYLSFEPQIPDSKRVALPFDPYNIFGSARGEFEVATTTKDMWNLGIQAPCFEGECPANYDNRYGDPLPIADKGKTFECTVEVTSSEIPPLVRLFGINVLQAATSTYQMLVSATFTGGPGTLPNDCCSSVAFIPGLKASRLAIKNGNSENILWEPNRNADVQKLYLHTTGNSIDPNVYTKGLVDTVRLLPGFHIYKTFMDDMDGLVQSGTISEWKALPYDWRKSLDEIVDDGTLLSDGGTEYMVGEIENLAAQSKTGKVTLVTHSNGGLVSKTLIQRLESLGKSNLVDKIIMVASPQLGTPQSIPDILHGTEIFHGIIMSNNVSRGLSLNMPGAYQLLPSREYFNTVVSPVISFDSSLQGFNNFISKFGSSVTDYPTLKQFILDITDNRTPNPDDSIDKILTLNPNLIRNADTTHNQIDSYEFPSSIDVYKIAGWGIDTISGIEYYKKVYVNCINTICTNGSLLDYKPIFTIDGDKTVVTPSATYGSGNKYYLNLDLYNTNSQKTGGTNNHANILEVSDLRVFIKNIIQGISDIPQFISTTEPTLDPNNTKYRISVHSPVSLDLYDMLGRHTGLIKNINSGSDLKVYEENIPNSYYAEIGHGKYVGVQGSGPININLTGTGVGTFTLDIEKIQGNILIKKDAYSNIPVASGTKAYMSLDSVGVSSLNIDYNGDGVNDSVLLSGQKFNAFQYLKILRSTVVAMQANETLKKTVLTKIDATMKMIDIGMLKDSEKRIQDFLSSIENQKNGTPPAMSLSIDTISRLVDYVYKIQLGKM